MKIEYEEKNILDGERNKKTSFNKNEFLKGFKDGIPIGLGYFAVSFTLGIAAKNIGFTPFQAALMSATMHASAGEFAVMTVISAGSGYLEMAVTQVIVNLRYVLMSCALSQKLKKETSIIHRLILSCFVTDEIFALDSARKSDLNPFYNYGMASVASPGWVIGTFLGVVLGNIMPVKLASAMNIALYGMFIAVVVPPSKKNKTIAIVVISSMTLSFLFAFLPYAKNLSSGFRIIILTIVISAIAAIIHPVKEKEEENDDEV